jgi:hypothetical protein
VQSPSAVHHTQTNWYDTSPARQLHLDNHAALPDAH